MARRTSKKSPKNPLIELDKDIAEAVFGRRYGRPTISRHAGRAINGTFGTGVGRGTDLFHAGLVGLAAVAVLAASKRSAPKPAGSR